MQLTHVKLVNFRGYKQENAPFSPGLNCIEGLNGSGKSNLLEAIYLLSTGKSFRTHKLHDLIHNEEETFILEASFVREGISHTLSVHFGKEGRKIRYDATHHASFLPLLGKLPSTLLCPEDIAILNGGPAERRRFLDLHLAQVDPLYLHHLGRYQRALKQRNAQLKLKQEKGLTSWETLMAHSASYLLEKRLEALAILERAAQPLVLHLSKQREPLNIHYTSSLSCSSSDSCIEKWEKTRKRDMEAGTTLLGPHRDDILFLLQGRESKTFASEGQKRCLLAALRLAEWQCLKRHTGTTPLFGIDDFGSHLDEERLELLYEPLEEMGQVFLTAPSFLLPKEAHSLLTLQNTLRVHKKIDV